MVGPVTELIPSPAKLKKSTRREYYYFGIHEIGRLLSVAAAAPAGAPRVGKPADFRVDAFCLTREELDPNTWRIRWVH